MPDTPMNDWFLQESSAYILDNRSAWDGRDTGIYRRLYDNTASRSYILPLLSVSEDSIYMIANSTTITYGIVDCYIDRNLIRHIMQNCVKNSNSNWNRRQSSSRLLLTAGIGSQNQKRRISCHPIELYWTVSALIRTPPIRLSSGQTNLARMLPGAFGNFLLL